MPDSHPRAALAADGLLLTAGAFSLFTAITFGLDAAAGVGPLGSVPRSGLASLLMVTSWILGVSCFYVGPLAAWLLHHRRLDAAPVIGGLAGIALGGIVVLGLTLLASIVSNIWKLVTGAEFTGAIVTLAVYALLFLVVSGWLVADAVRDLNPARRIHARLDIARLAAAGCAVVFALATLAYTAATSGLDPEASVFLLASGVVGGVTVTAADYVVSYVERRSSRS